MEFSSRQNHFLAYIRNDYDSAENYYKKSIEINPDNAINIGNYEFDTDPTTDNAFMTRRNSAQKMGYIFNERIYDNDISPLAEVINTRKYISEPDKTY